jgi:hypothetical protein
MILIKHYSDKFTSFIRQSKGSLENVRKPYWNSELCDNYPHGIQNFQRKVSTLALDLLKNDLMEVVIKRPFLFLILRRYS